MGGLRYHAKQLINKGIYIFSPLSLLSENRSRLIDLWNHHVVLSVCASPPPQLLNACANLYEISYIYYATWAHPSGVLHTSLPPVCVSVYVSPIVAEQRFGRNVNAATNTHATIKELLDAFSMRSVLYEKQQAVSSSQNFLFSLV
jgi:hypothetical protein